jgi:hypothetical protein
MTFYSNIDSILQSNSPKGTNVPSNITGGEITLPHEDGINPGAGIGVAYPVSMYVSTGQYLGLPATTTGNDYTIAAGAYNYLPLEGFITPVLTGFTLPGGGSPKYAEVIDYGEGDKRLVFVTPSSLVITTNPVTDTQIDLEMIISGYDQYGNPMTINETSLSTANEDKFYFMPRCMKSITSILATNTTNADITITIGICGRVELPYYNLGKSCNIMVSNLGFYNSESFTGMVNTVMSSTAPYGRVLNGFQIINPPASFNFNDLTITPLTANSGTVRPIIDLNTFAKDVLKNTTFDQFQDGGILSCIQNVYGEGSVLPNYWLNSGGNITQTNSKALVLGPAQWSSNWTPWQG